MGIIGVDPTVATREGDRASTLTDTAVTLRVPEIFVLLKFNKAGVCGSLNVTNHRLCRLSNILQLTSAQEMKGSNSRDDLTISAELS
jgi:hypothetical protein